MVLQDEGRGLKSHPRPQTHSYHSFDCHGGVAQCKSIVTEKSVLSNAYRTCHHRPGEEGIGKSPPSLYIRDEESDQLETVNASRLGYF